MSWIDTPLVQDVKADLPSFSVLLSKLPYPLIQTTTVEGCAKAFVRGIEKRSRVVYWPSGVRGIAASRVAINSRIGNQPVLKLVPSLLPRMDEEVAALGR